MRHVIYVDVLISLNLIIDFLLLLATAKFLNLHIKRKRLLIGSLAGSMYSLAILIPGLNMLLSLAMSLAVAAIIIFISFGFYSLRSFIKKLAAFYCIAFVFTGASYLLSELIPQEIAIIRNGLIYLDISPLVLVASTGLSYVIIRLITKLTARSIPDREYYRATISFKDKSCNVLGKVDSGSNLVEPFSNLPVIVVDEISIKPLLNPESDLSKYAHEYKFRMIPFHSLGTDGALQGFKPDSITLYKDRLHKQKQAYIAICKKGTLNGEFDALINPVLVE